MSTLAQYSRNKKQEPFQQTRGKTKMKNTQNRTNRTSHKLFQKTEDHQIISKTNPTKKSMLCKQSRQTTTRKTSKNKKNNKKISSHFSAAQYQQIIIMDLEIALKRKACAKWIPLVQNTAMDSNNNDFQYNPGLLC